MCIRDRLERLGVADEVRAIGMEKWGAEFISHWDGRSQEFLFAARDPDRKGNAVTLRSLDFNVLAVTLLPP